MAEFNVQEALVNMRVRINTLEDKVIRNETKLQFMTTVASLAAAAAAIEFAARFLG